MLSLYIHIPFCAHKCSYCSFFVLPENDAQLVDKELKLEELKDKYLASLLAENASWHEKQPEQQIKTIYIGGGTPFELGEERLFTLIDSVLEIWDVEFLEELTIELNPDPFDEVLDFIRHASRRYKHLYNLRFSIGIQTFDDEILTESKRNYVFNNLIRFFRDLQKIKQPFMRYNFDFIAFGKNIKEANPETYGKDKAVSGIPTLHPWDEKRIEFFIKLANSHVADCFSLYTLELFPGSQWYNKTNDIKRLQGNEEGIASEFNTLKAIINQAGYSRNEISNFSLMGKQSSHNMVYRTMQPYIGLGINSSSYIDGERFSNTKHWKKYLAGERQDKESIETLDEKTKKTEQAFLALRTMGGLHKVASFVELFEDNRQELIATREDAGLVHFDSEKDILKITDSGMNVYNGIITDLIKDI